MEEKPSTWDQRYTSGNLKGGDANAAENRRVKLQRTRLVRRLLPSEPVNPGGHAAWGALVRVDGTDVYRDGGYCGVGKGMSNNVAEYSGFLAALTEAVKYPGRLLIRGDSRLVICQLSPEAARVLGYRNKWKVNGGAYMPFYEKARPMYEANSTRITLRWVSRNENDICDVLSKQVLKDKGVVFRIQPE
jgi:ribonuclease HI